MYTDIIVPLGHEAEIKNLEFKESYGALGNKMTLEFLKDFSTADMKIDWEKLTIFNSSIPQVNQPKPAKAPRQKKAQPKKANKNV